MFTGLTIFQMTLQDTYIDIDIATRHRYTYTKLLRLYVCFNAHTSETTRSRSKLRLDSESAGLKGDPSDQSNQELPLSMRKKAGIICLAGIC